MILRENDLFPFDCHKGLECFTRCCRDINLFLTPYDILRLKNHLSLTSREFLDRYTLTLYMEKIGHPLVVLKMADEDKRCPFSGPNGCGVYADRPWSCRSFPLEPNTEETAVPASAGTQQTYSVVRRPFCLGFERAGSKTVREWLDGQGVEIYEEMNAVWSEVTLSKSFPAGGLDKTGIQMFFIGSFSLDEFRMLAAMPSFLETYSLTAEDMKPLLADEVLLFRFACRWLRGALLNEKISLAPATLFDSRTAAPSRSKSANRRRSSRSRRPPAGRSGSPRKGSKRSIPPSMSRRRPSSTRSSRSGA